MDSVAAAYVHLWGGFEDVTDDLGRLVQAAIIFVGFFASSLLVLFAFSAFETGFVDRTGGEFGLAQEFVIGSYVLPVLVLFAVFDLLYVYVIDADELSIRECAGAMTSNVSGVVTWVVAFVAVMLPLVVTYPDPFGVIFRVFDSQFERLDLFVAIFPVVSFALGALASFFVAPITVFEDRSPSETLRRNVDLLRATPLETTVSVITGVVLVLFSLSLLVVGVWLLFVGLVTLVFGIGLLVILVALLFILTGLVSLPVAYAYARTLLVRTYRVGVGRLEEDPDTTRRRRV